MKIEKDIYPLTPSEQKAIDSAIKNEYWKIKYICRSRGGDLMIHIERLTVRKTSKHVPPFRYACKYYNKWGKETMYKAGNIWKYNDILDNFHVVRPH